MSQNGITLIHDRLEITMDLSGIKLLQEHRTATALSRWQIMNLGSNVSLWIPLLPKRSNVPLVCCLSARLRGLLSLVEMSFFLRYKVSMFFLIFTPSYKLRNIHYELSCFNWSSVNPVICMICDQDIPIVNKLRATSKPLESSPLAIPFSSPSIYEP